MDLWDFLLWIEKIVTERVYRNFPIDWDEDFVTRDLLRDLRRIRKTALHFEMEQWYSLPFCWPIWNRLAKTILNIEWSAYKQTGTPERLFGDIAVLVFTQYPDGDRVEGVGFLEAKKRNPKNAKFDAIRVNQLRRIVKHAPRASMLLYDYEPVHYCHPWRPWKCLPQTFAAAVPMDLALVTKKRDASLYKFSKPFSAQLLLYLLGFELERTQRALAIAKGHEDRFGAPRYLLVLRVGVNSDVPPEDLIAYSRDRFTPIEEVT